MTEPKLTDFQRKAEEGVRQAIRDAGRGEPKREVRVGTMPAYSKDEQTVVHLSAPGAEAWIWEDDANLSIDGSDDRFERPDFDSEDALLTELLRHVQSRLHVTRN
jgi:hypothetical protein